LARLDFTLNVIIVGGGLAGLSAAAALGGAGHRVRLLESRPFLGGRATSYDAGGETIDNCQHVLLRCCVNLLDFYRRLDVEGDITFHREFYWLEPGGRQSVLRRSALSFLSLKFLTIPEKLAVARGLFAIARERPSREDLDRISMQQWLEEKRQPKRAIQRFWRQVLVSAISEELDSMSALHGFQVFRLGLLARSDAYEMGVPSVPLAQLYGSEAWQRLGNVEILLRTPVERVVIERGEVQSISSASGEFHADFYIVAVPF
jgi:phytoene dehydrogenase-like protein